MAQRPADPRAPHRAPRPGGFPRPARPPRDRQGRGVARHGAAHRRHRRPCPAAAANRRRGDLRGVPRRRGAAARAGPADRRGWRLLLISCSGSASSAGCSGSPAPRSRPSSKRLRLVVTAQFDRLLAFAATLGLVPSGPSANLGAQLLGSVGRLTSAVGSAHRRGRQRHRDDRHRHLPRRRAEALRPGYRWMLPVAASRGFYRIADHVGFTLRRLLFGRLVGMVFEGVFTWFMLVLGRVPMAPCSAWSPACWRSSPTSARSPRAC